VRFLSGLIIIYSWYFLYFVENDNVANIPRKLRHVITLLITVAVYFVGTFHLGKLKDTWMSTIWHIVHVSGLCIITTIGLFVWFIGDTRNLSLFARSIQEILISAVLYIAMGLLNRVLNKS
jgi:hypothetical protein